MDYPCKRTIRDWSGLPDGILEMILKELPLNDYSSFSNVCKSWRSIAAEACLSKPSLGFPSLMTCAESRSKARSCFNILENKVRYLEMPKSYGSYVWGSFQDWLVMVKPICTGTLFRISLWNPFSGAEVHLCYSGNFFSKLVFSGIPGDHSCMYLLFSSLFGFSLWILGTPNWCKCQLARVDHFILDVMASNDCFYLLTCEYNIRVLDFEYASSMIKRGGSSSTVIRTLYYQVEKTFETSRNSRVVLSYLGELCGEVVLVLRFLTAILGDTVKLELYRLDFDQMAWLKLDSLGDQVLFLTAICSKSFPAKELGEGTAGCINITNDTNITWDTSLFYSKSSTVDNWGIFKHDDDRSKSFSHQCGLLHHSGGIFIKLSHFIIVYYKGFHFFLRCP